MWVDRFGLDILYRSMCREEYYDIKEEGRRSNGGMEGKWFADSFANLPIIFVPLSFHWF